MTRDESIHRTQSLAIAEASVEAHSSRFALGLPGWLSRLFRTVLLAVDLSCLARVVHGVLVVAVRRMCMMSSLFMLAFFVMRRCLFVMACRLLVMLGSLAMVLCGLLRHRENHLLWILCNLKRWGEESDR